MTHEEVLAGEERLRSGKSVLDVLRGVHLLSWSCYARGRAFPPPLVGDTYKASTVMDTDVRRGGERRKCSESGIVHR